MIFSLLKAGIWMPCKGQTGRFYLDILVTSFLFFSFHSLNLSFLTYFPFLCPAFTFVSPFSMLLFMKTSWMIWGSLLKLYVYFPNTCTQIYFFTFCFQAFVSWLSIETFISPINPNWCLYNLYILNQVKENPGPVSGGLAPMYGAAGKIPDRGLVQELLIEFMDGTC